MRARWPWMLALLVLVAAPLVLSWRSTVAKHQESEGRRLAALALGPGREVAYEGRQKVLTRDEKNRLLAAEATKLTSTGGVSKLEYHGGELNGVRIWDDGIRAYRFNPATKEMSISLVRRGFQERPPESLAKNFRFRYLGDEVIAGRRAGIVEFAARNSSSRLRRRWVDRETGVILKSEDYVDGALRSRSEFVTIRILTDGEIPGPEAFTPSDADLEAYAVSYHGDTSDRFDVRQLASLLGYSMPLPGYMPMGYRLDGGYVFRCGQNCRTQSVRLEYKDGLNTLQVYLMNPQGKHAPGCVGLEKDTARVARGQQRGVTMVATGDLPEEELERIVNTQATQIVAATQSGAPATN